MRFVFVFTIVPRHWKTHSRFTSWAGHGWGGVEFIVRCRHAVILLSEILPSRSLLSHVLFHRTVGGSLPTPHSWQRTVNAIRKLNRNAPVTSENVFCFWPVASDTISKSHSHEFCIASKSHQWICFFVKSCRAEITRCSNCWIRQTLTHCGLVGARNLAQKFQDCEIPKNDRPIPR